MKRFNFKEYRVEYRNFLTGETVVITRVLSEVPVIGDTEFINGKFYNIVSYSLLEN